MKRMTISPYKRWWRIENEEVVSSLQSTRAQAGMVFTAARSSHPIIDDNGRILDAARLRLHGTLDRLRGGIRSRHKIASVTVYRLARNHQ